MSATKKRRRSPEPEDLAAAVADIINSPITRTTLNFLRPLEPELITTPTGLGPSPMGVDLDPMVVEVEPVGFVPEPMGVASRVIPAAKHLWEAEGLGAIFEESRIRRIQKAQDALSLVEEKVYDLLWGTKNQRRDEFRLVHYSLQRISTEARINIKTVRQLIPRLIEKGFLAIEHEADVRRNIPTLYKVPSYAAVLTDQRLRNRFAVAKTGKGVFYAHPYNEARPVGSDSNPVGVTPMGLESTPMGQESTPGGLKHHSPHGCWWIKTHGC